MASGQKNGNRKTSEDSVKKQSSNSKTSRSKSSNGTKSGKMNSGANGSKGKSAKNGAGAAKNSGNPNGYGKSSGNYGSSRSRQELYHQLIIYGVVAAVMVFCIFCNAGKCGVLGKIIGNVFFGLFGWPAFLLPFIVVVAGFILLKDNFGTTLIRKTTLFAVFYVFFCAACHLWVHADWGFSEFISSVKYSAENKGAGGAIGALIISLFYPALSKTGTWVLVILVMLVLFCLVFLEKIVDFVKDMKAYYSMDEEEILARETVKAKKRERARLANEERKANRKARLREENDREGRRISEINERMSNVPADDMGMQQAGAYGRGQEVANNEFRSIILNSAEPLAEEGIRGVKNRTDKVLRDERAAELEANAQGNGSQYGSGVSYGVDDDTSNSRISLSRDGEIHITGASDEGDYIDNSNQSEGTYNVENNGLSGRSGEVFSDAISQVSDTLERNKGAVASVNTVAVFKDEDEFVFGEEIANVSDVAATGVAGATGLGAAATGVGANVAGAGALTASDDMGEDANELASAQNKSRRPRKTKASMAESANEAKNIDDMIKAGADEKAAEKEWNYQKPPIELLSKGKASKGNSKQELQEIAGRLVDTLASFGVNVKISEISCGPAVTRFEMTLEQGTRVNKITNLADDIKLAMAVQDVRIEAPIPGKSAVGIEMPNKVAQAVAFRDLLEQSDVMTQDGDLLFAVGKDIAGQVVIGDIGKMPHVLIAGATGSGKSVCINTLIMSILYRTDPRDVKLIMIDPKVVELSVYNGIPHLLIPVVTDPKKAAGALNWAVQEMDARYKKFAEFGVRNIAGYNEKVKKTHPVGEEGEIKPMPKIVVIVDELADLMMVAGREVEDHIVRITQLARAAGIHLVIATQRPSVDVITGLIKANVPSRIAFAVSSGVDSRTILDSYGAEKLLGKGDMLFMPSGMPKPVRVQGAFVSDDEVTKVVEFLKAQHIVMENTDSIDRVISMGPVNINEANHESDRDEYFVEAGRFILDKQKASIGMLQRMYKIGFNRAARIMDQLSDAGVVGPEVGTKPREILMTMEEFEAYVEKEC